MDLNTILIIVGIVALVALIVHGLWSNRREKNNYFEQNEKFNRTSANHQAVASVQNESSERAGASLNSPSDVQVNQPVQSPDDIVITIPNASPAPQPVQYPQPNSHVKDFTNMTIDEIEAVADENEGINSSSAAIRETLAEAATKVDYDAISAEPVRKQTSGYIQLYVISPMHHEFFGATLVQALDNLGFIWGQNKMFHRHMDLCDNSPILFTAANLQNEGQFDIYPTPDFSTVGISLFIQLPSPGSNVKNLSAMIHAAKSLAKELGGAVLTEDEQVLTPEAEAAYLARVA